MPDVQEVFRMATQKVGPKPGALDRQLSRQRRSGGARKVGAFAVAASFIAIAVAVFALTRTSGDSAQVATHPPAVPVPTKPGLYTVNVATGAIDSFPDPGGTGFTTSPDGSRIAFTNDVNGHAQVFVMNVDGTGVRRVTDDPYGTEGASWSPDGARIAYVGWGPESARNVFTVDLASGRIHQVTHRSDAEGPAVVTWSNRENLIAYTVYGNRQLRLVDVDTGDESVLLTDPIGAWAPVWSPDGTRVVYVHDVDGSKRAIWIMNADGSDKRQLVQSDDCCIRPMWSEDGTRIIYAEGVPAGGARTFALDPDTGARTPITYGWAETWIGPETLLVGFSPEDIAGASSGSGRSAPSGRDHAPCGPWVVRPTVAIGKGWFV